MDTQRRITLHGSLTGHMWMPASRGYLPITVDVTREQARIVGGRPTLRDVVDLITTEQGGDFQDARLSGDSFFTIEHTRRAGMVEQTRRRYIEATALPSIAEYVDADAIPDIEVYG